MSWKDQLSEVLGEGDDDQLLTRQQAADLLSVSAFTVDRWGRDGKLPRVVFGEKTIRYRMGDIRQMIREARR